MNHFDPSTDSALLRKAMKGFGTDEASIINVLANRTSDQRQRIVLTYQQAYGKVNNLQETYCVLIYFAETLSQIFLSQA